MNHMNFDPYLTRQRNQEMLREVRSLRLEERLRKERGPRGLWFVALTRRGAEPLLRRVGLVLVTMAAMLASAMAYWGVAEAKPIADSADAQCAKPTSRVSSSSTSRTGPSRRNRSTGSVVALVWGRANQVDRVGALGKDAPVCREKLSDGRTAPLVAHTDREVKLYVTTA
jgi:hypothetical protein